MSSETVEVKPRQTGSTATWNAALQAAVFAAKKGVDNWLHSSIPGGVNELWQAIEAEILKLRK
jgi:hypothetical protein